MTYIVSKRYPGLGVAPLSSGKAFNGGPLTGKAIEELSRILKANPTVTMVTESSDLRGPVIMIFVDKNIVTKQPAHRAMWRNYSYPKTFRGFPVVVKMSDPTKEISQHGLGNFLSKLLSDPVAAILSAPATAIDAGAGGPQKRARTKAAIAAGTATQAQIDEEKATRAAEIASVLAQAQQDAAALEAVARAKSKKTLTTTLAVGGAALLVVGGAFWLITGPKKKQMTSNSRLVAVFANHEDGVESRVYDLGPKGFSVALHDTDAGETIGYHKFFPTEDRAIAYAKKIVPGAT